MFCSFLTASIPDCYQSHSGVAAQALITHSAVSSLGGWPTLVAAVGVALTIASGAAIAWRQRAVQIRDREADRALQEARQHEQDLHEEKLARREAWRADYEAIRKLMEACEELAYHVRHEGPCTQADLANLGAATLRMNSERLAERGLPRLREPLLRITQDLDCLAEHAIIDHSNSNSAQSSGQVLSRINLHEIQRRGVLQDRAERDLTSHILSAWQILRHEWGA